MHMVLPKVALPLLATILLASAGICVVAPAAASDLHTAYDAAVARFGTTLSDLAAKSPQDRPGIESLLPSPLAVGERFYVAADNYHTSDEPAAPLAAATQAACAKFAGELVELAKQAAAAGEAALASRIVNHALVLQPDSAAGRAMLGHTRDGDMWVTPYAASQRRRGLVWDSRYGWIAPENLVRYQRGEREFSGRWLSRDDVQRRRSDIAEGWQIRTDHFVVTTNSSLEQGVQLAAQLETMHAVWWQMFADLAVTDSVTRRAAISGRGYPLPRRPMQVVYHRSRDEYNARLKARQPKIEVTLGIYFDRYREAHFFAGDDATTATLYHEAAHQLFQESLEGVRAPGSRANFWAIEGAALYFESLVTERNGPAGRVVLLGTVGTGRLEAARFRWVDSGYRVPLAEVVLLNQRTLQARSDLAMLYSQMAGLGHFFLQRGGDNDGGDRRAAFAEYLQLIYEGRDDESSLATTMQADLLALDKAYGAWVESLPAAP
jgi:hypothetical protein